MNNKKMKASIRRNYCSPNQIKIEQVEKPIPKDNQVLIKVYSSTVNRTDCAILTAKPFIMRFFLGLFKPNKIIVGTDFAGEIVSVGKKVEFLTIGNRVFGFNDLGSESQAEYLTINANSVYPIPKGIDFKQAAASLEGAHYAYSFINKVNIQSGQHILILGATGGIGSALLQFVRPYDVRITASSNTKNIELIQNLGAHNVFDFTTEDYTKNKSKYDFIFDTVGKSTFGKCKPLLNKNGVYISSELGPYAQNIFFPLFNSISNKKVIFPTPYQTTETIPFIISQLGNGNFKPVIEKEYLLEEISKAYEYVIKGEKTGNIIIQVN
jgi:NADPH:quinone reductase-like Zn-dependent oxidoreductase